MYTKYQSSFNTKHLGVKQLFQKSFLLLAMATTLFSACKKEPANVTPQPLETGTLSVSKSEVVLDSSDPAVAAVKVNWTAPANSMITYKLVLVDGTKTDTTEVAKGAVDKTYTMGELNNILVKKLNMVVGVKKEIKVTLLAFVAVNGKNATSNTVALSVTPAVAGAAYSKLYMVGDATPNGWNINDPNEMTADPTNAFQFRYNGLLNAGEFKIPVATGNWGGDFFMPATNNPPLTDTQVKLIIGGNPDNKWRITNPGAYKIVLNISSSPSIQIKPFTPYTALYMVGDATPAGWNIDNPTPLTAVTGNPYIFTYTGPMSAGDFKIPVAKGNWNGDFFMPVQNGEGLESKVALFVPGGNPDHKWKIKDAGNYKITINQLTETIAIEKQ